MNHKSFIPEAEFDEYLEVSGIGKLPRDSVQYREMQRAFIAGAAGFFGFINSLIDLPDEVSEEELTAAYDRMMEYAESQS